jgi:predicted acylesterase/phospholipase RssA
MRKALIWIGIVVVVVAGAAWYVKNALELPTRLEAVPVELTTRAIIPGIPNARYWVGVEIESFARDVLAAREREIAWRQRQGQGSELPPASLLAVSGGGDKGAFGAGLLNGWTDAGTRPEFKAVTGVSTGALIAPFAFLGPEYDPILKEVYTSISPEDVLSPRSIIAAIENDGMADNSPLWTLISEQIDQALLDRIAEEHNKGRILLVGTTDLDARQPVVWNMGNIAASGAPNALDLFRQILLASAAIPGAFPPTMFPVEVDGREYQEMHVDGGASAQVFMYPPRLREVTAELGTEITNRAGAVYIIRNSSMTATWDPVERRTINIAGRAIDSLIHTQGLGDLYRIYTTTQRDGLDFNLAYIGNDFVYQNKTEQFETAFMVSLYDYGYAQGRAGYAWQKVPPGLQAAP